MWQLRPWLAPEMTKKTMKQQPQHLYKIEGRQGKGSKDWVRYRYIIG
jgi:hypothetical protein